METMPVAGRSCRRWGATLLAISLALLLTACAKGPAGPVGPPGPVGATGPQGPSAPALPRQAQAEAELKNAAGTVVGLATLTQQGPGVVLQMVATDLPPGKHGLHIHTVGKCEGPGFTTAGGHFNPQGKQHGLLSSTGSHAGDLPNLEVSANGTASLDTLNLRITLQGGVPNSVFQEGGTALVVHGGPDDETTDPTGNAGARIACGAITKK